MSVAVFASRRCTCSETEFAEFRAKIGNYQFVYNHGTRRRYASRGMGVDLLIPRNRRDDAGAASRIGFESLFPFLGRSPFSPPPTAGRRRFGKIGSETLPPSCPSGLPAEVVAGTIYTRAENASAARPTLRRTRSLEVDASAMIVGPEMAIPRFRSAA